MLGRTCFEFHPRFLTIGTSSARQVCHQRWPYANRWRARLRFGCLTKPLMPMTNYRELSGAPPVARWNGMKAHQLRPFMITLALALGGSGLAAAAVQPAAAGHSCRGGGLLVTGIPVSSTAQRCGRQYMRVPNYRLDLFCGAGWPGQPDSARTGRRPRLRAVQPLLRTVARTFPWWGENVMFWSWDWDFGTRIRLPGPVMNLITLVAGIGLVVFTGVSIGPAVTAAHGHGTPGYFGPSARWYPRWCRRSRRVRRCRRSRPVGPAPARRKLRICVGPGRSPRPCVG